MPAFNMFENQPNKIEIELRQKILKETARDSPTAKKEINLNTQDLFKE